MRVTKSIALALIFLTGSCASNRREWKRPKAPKEPLRGGVASPDIVTSQVLDCLRVILPNVVTISKEKNSARLALVLSKDLIRVD